MYTKELKMVELAAPRLFAMVPINTVPTITYLEMAASECFLDNRQGPAIESLRRCLKAIHNCSPYRGTKEYEDLIIL